MISSSVMLLHSFNIARGVSVWVLFYQDKREVWEASDVLLEAGEQLPPDI